MRFSSVFGGDFGCRDSYFLFGIGSMVSGNRSFFLDRGRLLLRHDGGKHGLLDVVRDMILESSRRRAEKSDLGNNDRTFGNQS